MNKIDKFKTVALEALYNLVVTQILQRIDRTLTRIESKQDKEYHKVETIKSGNWDDPDIWSTGMVPQESDKVVVGHVVKVRDGDAALQDTLIQDALTKAYKGLNKPSLPEESALAKLYERCQRDAAAEFEQTQREMAEK